MHRMQKIKDSSGFAVTTQAIDSAESDVRRTPHQPSYSRSISRSTDSAVVAQLVQIRITV